MIFKDLTDKDKYYFWLGALSGLTPKIQHALNEVTGGDTEEIINLISDDSVLRPLSGASRRAALNALDPQFIKDAAEGIFRSGTDIVTRASEFYPKRLLEFDYDMPYVLFTRGDKRLLGGRNFAIVGTRRPTEHGKKYTEQFSESLTRYGFNIVSGMAMGIDAVAHRACIEAGGKTIAVLGSGHDHAGPVCNIAVYRKILETGLSVSEYLPYSEAEKYNFPRRNRLISALSQGVLVTEAGDGSGALITVEHALIQNVPVFALPGRISDVQSQGTLALIRSAQCAMVTKPEHILDELSIKYTESKINSSLQLDFLESNLLDMLKNGELHYDLIFERAGVSVTELNSLLASMEIKGLISRSGAYFYAEISNTYPSKRDDTE